MERWIGKVAVVTGASSGIGAAISVDLAKAGMIVVGLARRLERIEALKAQIPRSPTAGVLHSFKCDVSQEDDIKSAFSWIESYLGGVDVLINNAGIARTTRLIEPNNTQFIREVLDTNIFGVVLCTREAFQSMKNRNVNGHIILINSTAGHTVPPRVDGLPSLNIYPASKHAITALTEVLRQEFQTEGSSTKITVS